MLTPEETLNQFALYGDTWDKDKLFAALEQLSKHKYTDYDILVYKLDKANTEIKLLNSSFIEIDKRDASNTKEIKRLQKIVDKVKTLLEHE